MSTYRLRQHTKIEPQPTPPLLKRILCRLLGHDPVGFWSECECRRCGRIWKCP